MNKIIAASIWFVCILTINPNVLATTHSLCNSELKSIITQTINSSVATSHANGTMLIACHDEIIIEKSIGIADLSNQIPITNQTQFLLASNSKQFTAVAILKALYDKNIKYGISETDIANLQKQIVLDLGKPVSFYLDSNNDIWDANMPKWADQVTLHQLLTHSSGIANVTILDGFSKLKEAPPNVSGLISFFKYEKLEFQPGERYSYSNSNYILLGEIIQQITGTNSDVYMQTALFEPNRMHNTFLATQGTVNDLIQSDHRFRNLARGYSLDIIAQTAHLTEVKKYEPMQIPRGAGSIISTAHDVLKWNNALYSGKIIPKFLLKLMTTPYMDTEKMDISYGYGLKVAHSNSIGTYYFHNGSIPGFLSNITYIPSLQLTMIILTNTQMNKNNIIDESLYNFKAIGDSVIANLEDNYSKNIRDTQAK